MQNVVASDRFSILLAVGQYLPLQKNFTDKILSVFFPRKIHVLPLQETIEKLALLPWETPKEAAYLALNLMQQGWQQLNLDEEDSSSFSRASKEYFKGQLYCFQAVCTLLNEEQSQPQLLFDYVSKALEAFTQSQCLYGQPSTKKAISLLQSLVKNAPLQEIHPQTEPEALSHSALAHSYIEQKKWSKASKHFKKAVKKFPYSLVHQTEKNLSEKLKQISELQYLCQTTPIVLREETRHRYKEMIDRGMTDVLHMTLVARKSLIFTPTDENRWLSALKKCMTNTP